MGTRGAASATLLWISAYSSMACSVSVVVLASSIKASTSGVVQKQRLPEGPRASVWYMDRSMESGSMEVLDMMNISWAPLPVSDWNCPLSRVLTSALIPTWRSCS